jgi:hypothetical protein
MFFKETQPPSWFKGESFTWPAKWLTWSDETRKHLHEFADQTAEWVEPKKQRLLSGKEFDLTFTHGIEHVQSLKNSELYMQIARALMKLRIKRDALLFRELLDGKFGRKSLVHLWAVLRDCIVGQTGQPMTALYAPLSYVGRSAGQFPLHADLYAPQYLWNVFDSVPTDGSGAALLLRLDKFFSLAKKAGVPRRVQKQVLNCFSDESQGERFRQFYDLLHVNGITWAKTWGELAEKAAARLPFGAGEGYLIHDRSWLHGRETPTGGVTVKRVHRLVYG